MNIKYWLSLALALSALFCHSFVGATTFGVSPVRLVLGGATRTASVVVSNTSTEVLNVKLDPVIWTMNEAGVESYQPTDKLLLFPRELVIAPDESRTIRVGLDAPAVGGDEATYRLFIRQQPNARLAGQTAVNVVVNFGVPIFVQTPGAKAQLSVKAAAVPKAVSLTLENTGKVHAKLERIRLEGSDEDLPYGSAYVLTGNTRVIEVPVTAEDCKRGGSQVVLITSSAGTTSTPVDLQAACR